MAKKISRILGLNEIKNYKNLLKQLFCEFLGTFLFLALVLSAGIAHGLNNPHVAIALAHGFIVTSIVYVFGHISGAHINPAITLGALVCERIKPFKAICYVIMHVLGSITGAAVAYAVSSEIVRADLGATLPFMHSTILQVFALEFMMTFLLVAVVLAVTDNNRGAKGLGSTPLAIGLCISGCLCACLPYTGSLNPVRTLGPAVVMNIHHFHWVYWLAPLSGGLVAGVVYRFVLTAPHIEYHVEEQ